MPSPSLRKLQSRFGHRPFRISDGLDAGLARKTLYRLRDRGLIVEVSRGVMQLADADPSTWGELAAVSARVPHGAICLNSALAYWDLTDELPDTIHLAVPRGTHPPAITMPSTTVHRFARDTFEIGRLSAETETGESFSIYSPERSVVDAMRLQHVVGRDLALGAFKRYWERQGALPLELLKVSRAVGGERRVRDALEVVMS